jgi:hypothetical protein
MRITVCLLVITMFAFTSVEIAAAKYKQTTHKQKPVTITGTVEKSDQGLTIKAGTTTYVLKGQDLSTMVGKTVAVTGMTAKINSGIKSITVEKYKEMK